ncbi:MAG: asparagine synthetase B, partial [Cytophagales bacterium]|nr:asparagine synthetase B [Cytophagales bacterium]
MCGIAGIVGLPTEGSENIIQGMVLRLGHRGPDDAAIAVHKNVAFGQSRLSIIDLNTRSNQPFYDVDRQFMMVYNGEIYNYKELRDTIYYPWQTTSDTEVVLAAYIKYGHSCLNLFNGMYAIAIWNFKNEELFVARDKMGVKPFYYHRNDQVLVFSSELRSLLHSGMVSPNVDQTSISEYLTFMAVPSTNTMISEVEQLPAGHFGIFKDSKWQVHEFWSL